MLKERPQFTGTQRSSALHFLSSEQNLKFYEGDILEIHFERYTTLLYLFATDSSSRLSSTRKPWSHRHRGEKSRFPLAEAARTDSRGA